MNIEQVFLLHLLKQQNTELLDEYVDKTKVDDLVFQDLHVKGYINLIDKDHGYVGSNIIANYVDDSHLAFINDVVDTPLKSPDYYDTCWEEFINTYPKKEGHRPLHNNKKEAKKKYVKYLKEGLDHNQVISAIHSEVYARKRHAMTDKFYPPWKLMTTYVNQKSWEAWEGTEIENKDIGEEDVLE